MRTLFLSLLVSGALAVSAAEHPRLFFHADDLPGIRERVQSAPVASAAFEKLKTQVDLNYTVKFPASDASIREGWRSAVYSISGQAKNAAFCWLVTGDVRYRDLARRILIETAENFDARLNFHRFADRSYMRIYFTGALGLNMAWAYDMLYNDLSEADRKLIEDKLLRGIVRMVQNPDGCPGSDGNAMAAPDYEWGPGQWNGVMYCNSGIAACGFALNDPAIIEHAVGNYRTYVAREILSDGLFQEEDWHYAAFCIDALTLVAELAHNCGYPQDLYNLVLPAKRPEEWDARYASIVPLTGENKPARSLRDIYDAMLECQYPDLSDSNLGWQMNSAQFKRGNYATLYELAWRRFNGHPYGWVLQQMDRSSYERYCYEGIAPILFGDQPVGNPARPAAASRVFNHGGWLVLKSIEGENYWGSDAIYAFTPYGNTRTKGLQRLSLDLFAFGRPLAPRVAKTSRHQSHDHDWYLHQPAWNNLMVDGENITDRRTVVADSAMRFQSLEPGSPVRAAQPVVQVQYRELPSIWNSEISMRREDLDHEKGRALMMTRDYLLDISHVKYARPQKMLHNYCWNLHGTGKLELQGAEHDQKVKHPVAACWRYEDGTGLKSTLLVDPADEGTIIYQYATPQSSFMQAMRCGRSALVAAVHEPFRGEPEIDSIKQLWLKEFAVAVGIRKEGAYHDIHCFSATEPSLQVRCDGFEADIGGPYAFFRLEDGVLTVRGPVKSFRFASEFFSGPISRMIVNGTAFPVGGAVEWISPAVN